MKRRNFLSALAVAPVGLMAHKGGGRESDAPKPTIHPVPLGVELRSEKRYPLCRKIVGSTPRPDLPHFAETEPWHILLADGIYLSVKPICMLRSATNMGSFSVVRARKDLVFLPTIEHIQTMLNDCEGACCHCTHDHVFASPLTSKELHKHRCKVLDRP